MGSPRRKDVLNQSKFWVLVAVVVFVSSCATIESTKAPEQTEKIDDVFVIVNPGNSFASFGKGVKEALQKKFTMLHVTSEIVVPTGLELEDNIKQQAVSHHYVLTINLTEGTVTAGWTPIQVGGNYDISLFSVAKDQRVWRAALKMQNNYGIAPGMLVDKMIGALQKDGLVDMVNEPAPQANRY
jgi:hypothetical protein